MKVTQILTFLNEAFPLQDQSPQHHAMWLGGGRIHIQVCLEGHMFQISNDNLTEWEDATPEEFVDLIAPHINHIREVLLPKARKQWEDDCAPKAGVESDWHETDEV